jgi:hypothetical protein
MRATLFTLIWAASSVALAGTTVYKWVDEDGVIHYSDQPHENADKVNVREPTTYSSKSGPPQQFTSAQVSPPPGGKSPGPYERCSLSQPTPDQVFLSTFSLTVVVDTVPELRPGDRIVVTLDGRPLTDQAGPTHSFKIDPIERGTHSVEATVQDPGGQPVCTTPSATFHVRQPSLYSPQRPRG